MKARKFGPRYGFKKFGKGGATTPTNPMDDLAPRGNLPTKEDLKPPKGTPPPKKTPPPEPPMTEKEKEMAREAEQAKKDKKSRDAYERFQKSPENDSPGYKFGGSVKKYAGGGMPMPGVSTKPKPVAKPAAKPAKGPLSQGPINSGLVRMKSGGSVSSASKRADGCAVKGKTRGKFV